MANFMEPDNSLAIDSQLQQTTPYTGPDNRVAADSQLQQTAPYTGPDNRVAADAGMPGSAPSRVSIDELAKLMAQANGYTEKEGIISQAEGYAKTGDIIKGDGAANIYASVLSQQDSFKEWQTYANDQIKKGKPYNAYMVWKRIGGKAPKNAIIGVGGSRGEGPAPQKPAPQKPAPQKPAPQKPAGPSEDVGGGGDTYSQYQASLLSKKDPKADTFSQQSQGIEASPTISAQRGVSEPDLDTRIKNLDSQISKLQNIKDQELFSKNKLKLKNLIEERDSLLNEKDNIIKNAGASATDYGSGVSSTKAEGATSLSDFDNTVASVRQSTPDTEDIAKTPSKRYSEMSFEQLQEEENKLNNLLLDEVPKGLVLNKTNLENDLKIIKQLKKLKYSGVAALKGTKSRYSVEGKIRGKGKPSEVPLKPKSEPVKFYSKVIEILPGLHEAFGAGAAHAATISDETFDKYGSALLTFSEKDFNKLSKEEIVKAAEQLMNEMTSEEAVNKMNNPDRFKGL